MTGDKLWTAPEGDPEPARPLRHALEVRHPGFRDPRLPGLLREHDIALVTADTAGKWPYFDEPTASDFAYARLHGDVELYTSGYTDEALDVWAARIAGWRAEREVFVYFDNDVKVRAPVDAMGTGFRPTRCRVGLKPVGTTASLRRVPGGVEVAARCPRAARSDARLG